jgi:hypothetical protein
MTQVPSRHTVLGVLTGTTPRAAEAAVERLRARYTAVPGLAAWTTSWAWLPDLRTAVVLAGLAPPALVPPFDVVWGCPIGEQGPATEAERAAALTRPESALELDGVFVLLRAEQHRVRVVTSAAFAFTLRRCGSAFATRAAGALALADRALAVDTDAAVEAVVWQAVLQDGEVLQGVAACEEATTVDITRQGVVQRSYASLGERMASRPPPTVTGFRDQVARVSTRFAQTPGARLGLTGGRDSALVASCLAESGGALPTFTMGPERYADVRAAKAVAAQLGWPHVSLPVTDVRGRTSPLWPARHTVPDGRLADWLVRHAPWGEGLQHPRDALVGRLRWDGAPFTAVTGHSGEVGRAFYWETVTDADLDADPVAVLTSRGTAAHLPATARAHYADVLAVDVSLARDIGRPEDALDIVYARRQRSWLDHGWLPEAPVQDVLPVFLAPSLVSALLDVPRPQRREGRFFDAAIAGWRPELRVAATDEAARDMRAWRLLGPLNPYRLRDDWPLLAHVLAEFEPEGMLVRDLLGDAWWQGAVAAAREQPGARAPIWNAVAVEALHRSS